MDRKSRTTSELDNLFVEDLKDSARESLGLFFRHKDVMGSRSEILSDYAVNTLMNTGFEGFDYAHEHLLPRVPRSPTYDEPSMKWEVKVLLGLLAEMRQLGIPKVHHPGLTLLYFRFCKGWSIPEPMPLP